jgi:hypothetical protein
VCADLPHKRVRNFDDLNLGEFFCWLAEVGDAFVMIDIATATSRMPCAYDHRLRNQAVRSGTRCLPKHVAIPVANKKFRMSSFAAALRPEVPASRGNVQQSPI